MAMFWDTQPHLPTEIHPAIWAALGKLKQAQHDGGAKESADKAILGALGNIEKFNDSNSDQREKPKSNK